MNFKPIEKAAIFSNDLLMISKLLCYEHFPLISHQIKDLVSQHDGFLCHRVMDWIYLMPWPPSSPHHWIIDWMPFIELAFSHRHHRVMDQISLIIWPSLHPQRYKILDQFSLMTWPFPSQCRLSLEVMLQVTVYHKSFLS